MYEIKTPNIPKCISPDKTAELIKTRVEIGKMVAQTFSGMHGEFPGNVDECIKMLFNVYECSIFGEKEKGTDAE